MNLKLGQKLPYHFWDKKRKITLILGVIYLLLMFAATLMVWIVDKINYVKVLEGLEPDKIKFLYENNLLQKPLNTFWGTTFTFTWISNIAMGIVIILFAIYPTKWQMQRAMFLVTVYISITFLVFWALIFVPALINRTIDPLRFIPSVMVHFVTPVLGIATFIYNRKAVSISKWAMFLSFIPLLAYYFFAMIVYFISDDYVNLFSQFASEKSAFYRKLGVVIYPFLNFRQPFFYTGGNIFAVITLNLVLFVAFILLTIGISFFWYKVCKVQLDRQNKAWDVR
ncbi:MAGa3780 family membrane protein [Mycoplasma corogypsi]|uniref:MAGa3780 family membrane protein n=1 Tax=Mycoplasma corogypsi TaxID=2106 RepID=UPI0038732173